MRPDDSRRRRRAAFASSARAACAGLLLASALAGALAQSVQRPFPPTALRGTLVVGQTPEVTLNGRDARLAPGARIRAQNNMIELPASLTGQRLAVHYTIDINGDLKDVWILTPEELARRPWPTTPEQAARWLFDPLEQTWTRQ